MGQAVVADAVAAVRGAQAGNLAILAASVWARDPMTTAASLLSTRSDLTNVPIGATRSLPARSCL